MIRLKRMAVTIAAIAVVILMSGTAHSHVPYYYGDFTPAVGYNPVNSTYLVVFSRVQRQASPYSVCGRWLDNKGKQVGPDFLISTGAWIHDQTDPKLAYDSVNQRFLVTWTFFREDGWDSQIYGQFVNADGTLQGANFAISSGTWDQYTSSVAYGAVNQRFLVTWTSWSGSSICIYGQFINADGALFRDLFAVLAATTFPVDYYENSSAAYDNTSCRFLVTGTYCSTSGSDIRGQLVNPDGTLFGGSFIIATGPVNIAPIAYDSARHRFLVSWTGNGMYGQFVHGDGTLQGKNFPIEPSPYPRVEQSVVYDSVYQRFALAWLDERTWPHFAVYGGFVNPDGTSHGKTFPVSLFYHRPGDIIGYLSMAYNPTCANSLVAFEVSPTDNVTIRQKLTGPCRQTNLVAPQGGAVLPAGASYEILFRGGPGTDHFNIGFSPDNGATWKRIATDITGTAYTWDVPTFANNATQCLIKVTAFDAKNKVVGSEVSDAPFTITVVKLASPNGGESLSSGTDASITWNTNGTIRPVQGVQLFYSVNGGNTWRLITKDITGNPGAYSWTVPHPAATRRNCKVRVVLLDEKGRTIGTDRSDAPFTITP